MLALYPSGRQSDALRAYQRQHGYASDPVAPPR
jgi:hypothetical protein